MPPGHSLAAFKRQVTDRPFEDFSSVIVSESELFGNPYFCRSSREADMSLGVQEGEREREHLSGTGRVDHHTIIPESSLRFVDGL